MDVIAGDPKHVKKGTLLTREIRDESNADNVKLQTLVQHSVDWVSRCIGCDCRLDLVRVC